MQITGGNSAMTISVPWCTAAKALDWYRDKAGPTVNGIHHFTHHCELLSSSAVPKFCVPAQGTITAEHAMFFLLCSCLLWYVSSCPLLLWNACHRLLCAPPSLPGSSVLSSPVPPAEVRGTGSECWASQGLLSPAHNASVPSSHAATLSPPKALTGAP